MELLGVGDDAVMKQVKKSVHGTVLTNSQMAIFNLWPVL
jgi:hypothetical protein